MWSGRRPGRPKAPVCSKENTTDRDPRPVDSDAVTQAERAGSPIASGRVPSLLDYKGGMIRAERRPKISPVSVGGPTVGATGRSHEWSSQSESQDILLHRDRLDG